MPQSIPASGISFLLVQSQFRLLEANSILSRGFPLNEPLPILIAKYLWVVLWLYWLVSARKLNAVKKRESWQERLQHMLPLIAAYFLLFSTRVHFGWLNERFVSDTQAVGWTGVSLTAAGVAFAIWARWHLGENWSSSVTLKADHELIRNGPYRFVRHPIYTGILLAMAGTALAVGELRGVFSFLITLASFYRKARREEQFLLQEFGDRFKAHASQTGMFLPRFS